ncbi:MAG TPA: AbiV family abortive infection protein [Bacteroidia bacterium]|nr:AbiV family abortive infection protein [Bacteroidia bacterium]
MNIEDLHKFNKFRELCLINAEDAIKTAEELKGKNVNHIAFQLVVFCLEEIGKIFIGWYQINAKETWGKEHFKIPIDDHIKKLFWSIWGPSFTKKKVTKTQMEEFRKMASNLHNKRLDVMYTELSDTIPSSQKISNEDLEIHLKFARVRLELSKLEGEMETNLSDEKKEDLKWFLQITSEPEKRDFIFGNQSQEKLIEFGEVQSWIEWLKKHFETEKTELSGLLKTEFAKRKKANEVNHEPKWKIRLKINSPSHSIRANVLNKFNSSDSLIKFSKGADAHTLIIDIILDKQTSITELWHQGWTFSNLLVASLNVGTNGLFYWNLPTNPDKFYEKIWDLENNKQLEAKLKPSFQLDWSSKKMYLNEQEIVLTFLVLKYFTGNLNSENFVPIEYYMKALGMLAKNDMHLRLETECFFNFFLAFKDAVKNNENCLPDFDIKEVGFKLVEKLIKERKEFDKIIDIGIKLENGEYQSKITLMEIIGMKQYSGLYFIILSARKENNDGSILLTNNEN